MHFFYEKWQHMGLARRRDGGPAKRQRFWGVDRPGIEGDYLDDSVDGERTSHDRCGTLDRLAPLDGRRRVVVVLARGVAPDRHLADGAQHPGGCGARAERGRGDPGEHAADLGAETTNEVAGRFSDTVQAIEQKGGALAGALTRARRSPR